MSSHHSQRFFDLHHQQVAGGKERRCSRFSERIESFREQRSLIWAEVRRDYMIGLSFSLLLFLFMAAISVVYPLYLLKGGGI